MRICDDVLYNVLYYGKRRQLSKFQASGKRFKVLIDRDLSTKPFIRLTIIIRLFIIYWFYPAFRKIFCALKKERVSPLYCDTHNRSLSLNRFSGNAGNVFIILVFFELRLWTVYPIGQNSNCFLKKFKLWGALERKPTLERKPVAYSPSGHWKNRFLT